MCLRGYGDQQSFGQKIEGKTSWIGTATATLCDLCGLDIRDDELVLLRRYLVMNVWMNVLWRVVPIAVGLTTFAVYTLSGLPLSLSSSLCVSHCLCEGNELTAANAFTSLVLFDVRSFSCCL